ncbi:MAG: response regulator [Chitinispirillaceae bacterium]|nr:response regulator [Chitinispirillaceae bacterium]
MAPAGKKILIVDDEPAIVELIETYLKKQGFEVLRAGNGNDALAIVKTGSVDLVVSDIMMPGMSGVELLRKIREYSGTLPVLLATGFPTMETAIEALKAGAYDYIAKPFHFEEIGEKVRRALLQRHLQEENILFSKLISLHEVTKILASTLDVAELNGKFLDFSTRLARADGGAIFFMDPDNKLLLAGKKGDGFKDDFWLDQPFVLAARRVLEHEEPLAIESGSELPDKGLQPLPHGIHSYVAFPLKTPSRTIGVLNLVREAENDPFSNLDLELINVLASQASISIENVRLYQNIRDNYLKTIRAFALAVEAKDEYTHGHSENVSNYTVMIATQLALPSHEIEQYKYAALLHDIGKIGVSDRILLKPGKLTPSEFNEMKKHPELGAKIIANVPLLKSLVPLVLHHHEYFGGGGYPHGIAGEEIPFGARILTVADSFEAMTSDRPYRKAMPEHVGLGILETQRGIQFDPAVVDAFKAALTASKKGKK